MKIGLGYDLHRLSKSRKLFLGGVEIPHLAGLVGHSDGDCLIHALVDALLGALGEGDIGQLFPDTDVRFRNVRSTVFLERVMEKLRKEKMEVVNIDAVVIAEKPKLAPHVERMKAALSPILGVPGGRIGIKAKTNEGIGIIGRQRAIACWVVVMLKKRG